MKKLLSICFLSIFLMMFSAQAQVDCCFSLSNPAADTLHNIANLPNGDLPLTHSMQKLRFGNTDAYDLVFSDVNCSDLSAGDKVSIELELWCDTVNVLDGQHNLTDYCDIKLQTYYNELLWLGTEMDEENYAYVFEYPGARLIYPGTYQISNLAFDYFYFEFLKNTHSRLVITWNQIFRDVQLVVNIRKREGGTDNDLKWDDQQRKEIGGHQSNPGEIVASDTLSNAKYTALERSIEDCDAQIVGNPVYTMDTTGQYLIAYVDTTCGYRIDSVVTYNFKRYVQPTKPTLSDSIIRYCQKAEALALTLPAEPHDSLQDHVNQIVAYWYFAAEDTFMEAEKFYPVTDTLPGVYTYYVKRHDNNTGCESEIDTFKVTVSPNPAGPQVTKGIIEYCVGTTATVLAYNAPDSTNVLWGTHPDIDSLSLTTITPLTDTARLTVYYLRLQDTIAVHPCVSETYDSIIVKVFDNPKVTVTADRDTLCHKWGVELTANPTTTDFTSYAWSKDGDTIPGAHAKTYTDTNKVTVEGIAVYSVEVTEAHDSVTCKATSKNDTIMLYPEIGAPTPVTPALADTAICGKQTVRLVVANGTNGTTSKWYAKDKTTELTTTIDTVYEHEFTETDTIYVSSLNAFGCETPQDKWLRRIITVDTLPVVTLSADNNAEVCAGMDLIIRSTPVEATYTYAWRGDSLKSDPTKDSVVFNSTLAGTFHDTLRVTNGKGCHNDFGIEVKVDTLPVLTVDVDYTLKDNEYCSVLKNGKITFNTEYVKYSIDNGTVWRNHPVNTFDSLPAGTYTLKVEDGNGCVNKPANVVEIKDTLTYPALTITDSANTRCEFEYNGMLMVGVAPAAATGSYEYSYQLNDGTAQTDSAFKKLIHGTTYKITVTNTITACKTDSLNQVVRDERATIKPTLTSTDNTHCDIDFDGTITVTAVTPATGAYHYKLATYVPDTTAYQVETVFSGRHHGLYSVIVEDTLTACVGSDTITVHYADVLPTATVDGPSFICANDTNTVFSLVSPDPSVVYFRYWSYVGALPDSVINTMKDKQSFKMMNYNTRDEFPAGTHIFIANIVDTTTHCTNTVRDTVRIIAVNMELFTDPATTVCEYDTVKVYSRYVNKVEATDSIVSYTWFNGNQTIPYAPGVEDTILVIPTTEASYVSLKVRDDHGCPGLSSAIIDVWSQPKIALYGDTAYCAGAATNLYTGITPDPRNSIDSIKWYKGSTLTSSTMMADIPNVGTADFTLDLKVEDNKGCKNDSTIHIKVVEYPAAPKFVNDSAYFCSKEDISIDTTGRDGTPTTGDFVWDTPSPNVVKEPGIYAAHYEVEAGSATCKSALDTVKVFVPGKPVATVTLKYNDDAAASTEKARCYNASAADTIKVTVTPAASATLTYEYKLNQADYTSTNMVVTQTEPGTYYDTIYIKATQTHPNGGPCTWDTTIYYKLTVNSLPEVPSNFPNAYNGGDSTIFYCQGGAANYTFNIPTGHSATYNGSTTAPTNANDNVSLVITNDATGCSSTFKYDIVEVATPKIVLTSTLADDCSDTLRGKVIAKVTPTYPSTYERAYAWTPASVSPSAAHSSYEDADTIVYTFRAPNDTIVTANVTVKAVSGPEASYSASCVSNDTSFIVTFQPAPDKPVMSLAVPGYVTGDSIAYCDGSSFNITASDFTTSTGATISMVDGNIVPTTDANKVYRVVANNNTAPNCPSDTLYVKVHKKRMPVLPTIDTVFYCAGTPVTYTITPIDAVNDTLSYYNSLDVLLDHQPDTAGIYTLRVADKLESCYKDTTLVIIEVPNPTATVTPSPTWVDSNICAGTTININYSFSISKTYKYTAVETYTWTGTTSTSNTANFTATPTADTSVIFTYKLVDTVGKVGNGVACAYNFTDTITYKYFATPEKPVFHGDTAFCEGESLVVVADSFKLNTANTELVSIPNLPDTFKLAGGVVKAIAQYTAFKSCKSDTTKVTIVKNALPTVNIAPDVTDTTVCKGTQVVFKATGATSYLWSTNATIDSIVVTDTAKYSVIGTDANGCKNVDTVELKYYPGFTVKLSNDTAVCVHASVNLEAVPSVAGTYTYSWYKDNVLVQDGALNTYAVADVDSSIYVNGIAKPTVYKVIVKDDKGCSYTDNDSVIKVVGSSRPTIEFRALGGTESIRYMEVNKNDQSAFEMHIKDMSGCPCNANEKVFIDFQVYKNGDPMTDVALGDALDVYEAGNNTVYTFDLTGSDIASATMKSGSAKAADYVPKGNSELIPGVDKYFDWVYMHFLLGESDGTGHKGRAVKVNTGMWKEAGIYTFAYAVVKSGPQSADNGIPYYGASLVGGHDSHIGLGSARDTVVFDYFRIYVDSVYTGESSFNMNASADVTPAPEAEINTVVDMKVYPNPASNNVNVVLEGISGQTMITVHDMSGKAVSSMRVDIANDGQIINLPVDNYSQGIYFVKAVNGKAVMTKKLIIAR
ncbi:MAG: T9SS type A sorting domain-containing protein [Bacteroidales bacterium]|nr:T9SS type A sorting domain-containing protein [Bacteroidales bacterium]